MFEGQISAELEARLTGKVRGIGTAIPKSRGKEIDGRSHSGAARQFTAAARGSAGQEEYSGVRLVWSNPTAMRKTAGRKTDAAFLMIEGGRK
ncbi:MAG: hypothetical protein EON59_12560 [Alphaproteobacteria bacterium]|nr:MAG: hypothetical protein EON59_12560 [Alphaproteobacteria bacterium]